MSLVTRGLGARTAGLATAGLGRRSFGDAIKDLWIMTVSGWEKVIEIYGWNGAWAQATEMYYKGVTWRRMK